MQENGGERGESAREGGRERSCAKGERGREKERGGSAGERGGGVLEGALQSLDEVSQLSEWSPKVWKGRMF